MSSLLFVFSSVADDFAIKFAGLVFPFLHSMLFSLSLSLSWSAFPFVMDGCAVSFLKAVANPY